MHKNNADLKTYAYDTIKAKIISCEFAPGAMLNEQTLSGELAISRTPLREALNRLDQDGLIEIIPKKGILVSRISIEALAEIYQVRMEFEPFVTRVAGPYTDKAALIVFRDRFVEEKDNGSFEELETDTEFHSYLVNSCNNKYIQQLMQKVLDENKRVMIATRNKARMTSARDEHIRVIDLILLGDYGAAADAMRDHLLSCRSSAFSYFMDQSRENGKTK
ncbi:GntR family transcriptional regulator [Christensenellaceae bacterium OttesenSCG-928-M15]|nr:GntR family transcriptional regulator [Christensenellaceae bacterium OttesenSCG-928-M15]